MVTIFEGLEVMFIYNNTINVTKLTLKYMITVYRTQDELAPSTSESSRHFTSRLFVYIFIYYGAMPLVTTPKKYLFSFHNPIIQFQ